LEVQSSKLSVTLLTATLALLAYRLNLVRHGNYNIVIQDLRRWSHQTQIPAGCNRSTSHTQGDQGQFLSGNLRVRGDEYIEIFTITKIKAAAKLPGIVFDNSRTTGMHDSLPLQLFSLKTILAALGHLWKIALFVVFPRFLLVSGLMTEGVSPVPDAICSRSLFICFIFAAN
jgi:hypothetical protein